MGSSTEVVRDVFPPEMAFQRTWRSYQSRLLDRLGPFLEDNRLHVVAAPGSGKTVFGLEVVRRINRPTLVLAPTITIRNQWVDRLLEYFLPQGTPMPGWVSTDIRHPKSLTVVTYQALHALCAGEIEHTDEHLSEEDMDATVTELSNGNGESRPARAPHVPEALTQFKTLVVDEAHHLRTEWWRTLTLVSEQLEPTVVALTATPPYDVTPSEWQRYEELCGPVDAEVAIPELVQQGDLCPHQDYVYFSTPAVQEQKTLADFRIAISDFAQRLHLNEDFTRAVAAHPWMTDPDTHIEQILDDAEYLSSMVVYLNGIGEVVPRDVLHALGISRKRIPQSGLDWLEVLLTHCLYTDADSFVSIDATLKSIRHELMQIGAIERRKVVLRDPSDHTKLLTSSITKLHSIEQIVRLEAGARDNDLRCVVLTDFIRKAEIPKSADDHRTYEDVGVVPIFETLRRAHIPGIRLGVLSGSLVIVPTACVPVLKEIAATVGIRTDDLSLEPLAHDASYAALEISGEYHNGAVRLMTAVFERGGITVMVGTKSLLGEGWDAPAINTLILASFVGSYVLSNQMRGRSIRVDPARSSKTANVWHLVCVEPGLFGPSNDYDLLVRRCSAFVGVSAIGPTIESGTARLGLGHPPYTSEQLADLNAQTCARALDRDGLRQQWKDALASGILKEMTDGLKTPETTMPRGFVLTNTIAALVLQAAFIFSTIFSELMRRPIRTNNENDFLLYVAIVAAISAVVSLPWTLLAIWRFIRHGTPERSIEQIGLALLEALEYEGSLDHHARQFRIYGNGNPDGSVYCWIGGGNGREQSIYLRALRELLQPIDNPRYLLARRKIWRFFREDYFAVPDILARKKEFAERFANRWRRYVGSVELVYTRTPEGRRMLLRARMNSLTAAFQQRSERVSCWK